MLPGSYETQMVEGTDLRSKTANQNPLTTLSNKVALLFHGANIDGRSLALSLASYGADIAIVYRQVHAGYAQEMKDSVKAKGRRCLIIQARTDDQAFFKEVVRQTINRLGRLDIYIDCSSRPGKQSEPVKDADIVEVGESVVQGSPFWNFEIMSAVLDQMVSMAQTDDRLNDQTKRKRAE